MTYAEVLDEIDRQKKEFRDRRLVAVAVDLNDEAYEAALEGPGPDWRADGDIAEGTVFRLSGLKVRRVQSEARVKVV